MNREARKSGQIAIQDVALEPELPLSTYSPVKFQGDAASKEVMLQVSEAVEATETVEVTEAVEATEVMKALHKHDMKDYGELIPKLERHEHMKSLWKRAMKKSHEIGDAQLKEKKYLKDMSETTTEKPKQEVIQITELEKDTRNKLEKSGRGLAGTPRRMSRSDYRSWWDDICYLITSRKASSHPGMLRDLGQELGDLAWVMLASQQPSWELFQEICPLLKDSSELDVKVAEEPSITTEDVVEEVVKEDGTVGLRKQGD